MMKKIKTKVSIVILLFAMIILPKGVAHATADASLLFDYTDVTVSQGESFTMEIDVDPGSHQASTVDLNLAFNPNNLRLDSIEPIVFSNVLDSQINNTTGIVSYSAAAPFGANVTTLSPFAILHFTALNLGASGVVISSDSAVYSDDEPDVNQLAASDMATVTISQSYSVGGTINGLSGTVVLQNNGSDPTNFSSNGNFTFANDFLTGDNYNITVLTQPSGQLCSVQNGAGQVQDANITNIVVNCVSYDASAPVRSQGAPSGTLSAETANVALSLNTNENATCKYSAFSNTAYDSMTGTFSQTGGTAHSTAISGLTNGTDYRFYVRCNDGSGNKNPDDYLISFSIASPQVLPQVPAVQTNSSSNNDSSDDKKETSTPSRYIKNSKSSLKKGSVLIQSGKNFSKNSLVLLYFSKPNGGFYAPTKITTTKKGAFSISYLVNKPAGKYVWYAVDTRSGRKSKTISYRVQ